MSEMIERVARAICVAMGHDPDGPSSDVYVEGDPDAGTSWAGYRNAARAAIEAMREPTDEMSYAGFQVNKWVNRDKISVGRVSIAPELAWQAMINTALSSNTTEGG